MKPVLDVLVAELRRLQAHGVQRVTVSDEALDALRKVVATDRRQPAASVAKAETRAEPTPSASPNAQPVAAAAPSFGEGVSRAKPHVETPPRAPAAAPRAIVPSPVASASALPKPPVFTLPEGGKRERWESLKARVLSDPVCVANVRPGKQVVLGVGSLDASLMFVGEAPGAEEEVRGEPFVGPAGELLTKMIVAMGLRREDVYIGNIMNWRPQVPTLEGFEQVGNRPPTGEEMAYCLPYLRAQIEIVQPKVLVALGKTAVDGLLGADRFKTLGEARGRWFDYAGVPLMVTYHPSYLLRSQSLAPKRTAWEDLLKVMEHLGLAISERQRGFFLPK